MYKNLVCIVLISVCAISCYSVKRYNPIVEEIVMVVFPTLILVSLLLVGCAALLLLNALVYLAGFGTSG